MSERKPYKFDDKRKEQYLERLRNGSRRHAAARAVGINHGTVCIAMKNDEAFCAAVADAESDADSVVEDALRTAALSGNVTAMLAWLYSRQPERWADMRKIRSELTTPPGKPLEVKHHHGPDVDRIAAIAGLIAEVAAIEVDGMAPSNGAATNGFHPASTDA